jgi:hypothetical protein
MFGIYSIRGTIFHQQHKLISVLFVYLEDTALYVYSGWRMTVFSFINILLIHLYMLVSLSFRELCSCECSTGDGITSSILQPL